MKYGIIVNGLVTEPVTVPPSREGDALAWFAIQFPGYSGWVLVSEDAVPGAAYNGDGTSTNPGGAVVPAQSWDAYDFKLRFTSDERKVIRAAAKVNADVEDFMDMLDTAAATGTRILSDNVFLRDGLELMKDSELIAESRVSEILGD